MQEIYKAKQLIELEQIKQNVVMLQEKIANQNISQPYFPISSPYDYYNDSFNLNPQGYLGAKRYSRPSQGIRIEPGKVTIVMKNQETNSANPTPLK
jgi:ABC-type Zn2+ transport system substrate-binding protein/surface adhesin